MSNSEDGNPGLDFDVIIIGAGISGINAAYRFQTLCPNLNYCILERRNEIGGTWTWFKYPGIRSDSDLYTFGFAWEPWRTNSPIADADSISTYIRYATQKHGIDKQIRLGHDITNLNWSSKTDSWTVTSSHGKGKESSSLTTRYLVASTGFFDYKQPLKAQIPDLDKFSGTIIHPQFWPEVLNYKDKRIAVVGSGATAITIVPAAAKDASKVTMIQRSPSYIHSLATKNPSDLAIRRWLPAIWSSWILRWKYALLAYFFFYFCKIWPDSARKYFSKSAQESLPPDIPFDPHFNPSYNVWDQRLCVCPDGDFWEALKSGKANVVTGKIKAIKANTVIMESGQEVKADILVTATGLKLQMLGGAIMSVDGQPADIGSRFMWRGTMVQDVPNAMLAIGYWNNSWTLGADLAVRIFIQSIKKSVKYKVTSFRPYVTAEEEKRMPVRPLWNMSSTYLKTGNQAYPKASDNAPWSMKDNYLRDWWAMLIGNIDNGLHFGSSNGT